MENNFDTERWNNEVLQPMFKKYESIPTKLKYLFIEKDYSRMYGKQFTNNKMRHMYDDTEDFIFGFENALYSFSKTVKKNLLKKYFEDLALSEFIKIHNSGSYFKHFSGKWSNDKEYFINFVTERESEKEYIKLILE